MSLPWGKELEAAMPPHRRQRAAVAPITPYQPRENHMKVRTYLAGDNTEKACRLVDIPDDEYQELQPFADKSDRDKLFELVFKYGQNDFQPIDGVRSLMVGDLIFFNGQYALIKALGFNVLSEEQLTQYLLTHPDKRRWSEWCRSS